MILLWNLGYIWEKPKSSINSTLTESYLTNTLQWKKKKEIKSILHGGKENLSSTTFKIKIYINSKIKKKEKQNPLQCAAIFL